MSGRINVIDSALVPHFDLRRDGKEFYWVPKEIYKVTEDDSPTMVVVEDQIDDDGPDTSYDVLSFTCPCGFSGTTYSEGWLQELVDTHPCAIRVSNMRWYEHKIDNTIMLLACFIMIAIFATITVSIAVVRMT